MGCVDMKDENTRRGKQRQRGGGRWRAGWREQTDAAQPAGGVFDEV